MVTEAAGMEKPSREGIQHDKSRLRTRLGRTGRRNGQIEGTSL